MTKPLPRHLVGLIAAALSPIAGAHDPAERARGTVASVVSGDDDGPDRRDIDEADDELAARTREEARLRFEQVERERQEFAADLAKIAVAVSANRGRLVQCHRYYGASDPGEWITDPTPPWPAEPTAETHALVKLGATLLHAMRTAERNGVRLCGPLVAIAQEGGLWKDEVPALFEDWINASIQPQTY